MQIESLSLFLTVIETRSITKAAQKMYITPQGASSAIKALEKQLGMKLFERTGACIELTQQGAEVAHEAQKVVAAYQKMQSVVAMQNNRVASRDILKVVATPFVRQTLTAVIQDYAAYSNDNAVVQVIEKNAFEIARGFETLDNDTLYLLDLPLDLEIASEELSPSFCRLALQEYAIFHPFVLSNFVIKCSEFSPYAAKDTIKWTDLTADQIACHDDPFLIKVIGRYVPTCRRGNVGMKVSNTELIGTAINQSGMIGISASLPVAFGERNWKKTYNGVAIEPKPKASFVTGALGSPENKHAKSFCLFMQNLLAHLIPSYMKKNDPSEFYKKNRRRFS
ncbi:LysR family transcriptional regulator [Raoultibacter phocaeensis]|uniref:LysR family transcriptional regulator n=1 Tax=Raoultibacter phocaeensis TaxID=2479841 RepID=UPI0015D5EDD4|nr:LysR family transcriptional regulator [Raoultibacter phocaeensis]